MERQEIRGGTSSLVPNILCTKSSDQYAVAVCHSRTVRTRILLLFFALETVFRFWFFKNCEILIPFVFTFSHELKIQTFWVRNLRHLPHTSALKTAFGIVLVPVICARIHVRLRWGWCLSWCKTAVRSSVHSARAQWLVDFYQSLQLFLTIN